MNIIQQNDENGPVNKVNCMNANINQYTLTASIVDMPYL